MNVFLIMLFIAVGIGCIWWLNRKHEENEAHQRIEKYIQEKEKEIQSDSIKKSEPNPSKVELSAENLQTISNTHESISQEESIEIRPDGTWICPNDETINDGDVCIICGQSRPGTTSTKVKPSDTINVEPVSLTADKSPHQIPKKGFSVAYSAKSTTPDSSVTSKETIPESVYAPIMDNTMLTYDDG